MNMQSQIRHLLTSLIGGLCFWLSTHLAGGLPAEVQGALEGLITPLCTLISAVVVVATRIAMDRFPFLNFLSDEKSTQSGGGSDSGGFPPATMGLFVACMLSVFMGLSLTACTTTTTFSKDGTRTTTRSFDAEAAQPFLERAAEIFPRPAPVAPVVTPDGK